MADRRAEDGRVRTAQLVHRVMPCGFPTWGRVVTFKVVVAGRQVVVSAVTSPKAQSSPSGASPVFLGWLSDRFGRKIVLLGGILGVIIATIIQATSTTYAQFVVSRLVVGAAGMLVVQPAPMLIAELAYPRHLGLTSKQALSLQVGPPSERSQCSRTGAGEVPTILQAGFPAVQLIGYYWIPESPRWLIANDRTQEALDILARYHAAGDCSSPLVLREMGEIHDTIKKEQEAQGTGWGALVATPGNRKRLFIVVCLGTFAQWNGIGVVSYYLTLVLNSVGSYGPVHADFDQWPAFKSFNFGAALGAAFLVDRLGRRTLFTWSGIGHARVLHRVDSVLCCQRPDWK
ncbi:hypothetical protein L1887_59117 [Cichorium endivia]|nr:hypothetical protein L1887_59117 [Cichorium endivia]